MTEVHSLEFQCASRVLINFSISELKLMKNAAQERLILEYKKKLLEFRPDLQDLIDQIVDVVDHTHPVEKQPIETPEMIIPLGEDPSSSLEDDPSDEVDWDSTDDVSEINITHSEERIFTDLWPAQLNIDIYMTFATIAIRIYAQRADIMVFPFEDVPSQIFWSNNIWHVTVAQDEKIIEFCKFLVREIYHLVYFFDAQPTTICNKAMPYNSSSK